MKKFYLTVRNYSLVHTIRIAFNSEQEAYEHAKVDAAKNGEVISQPFTEGGSYNTDDGKTTYTITGFEELTDKPTDVGSKVRITERSHKYFGKVATIIGISGGPGTNKSKEYELRTEDGEDFNVWFSSRSIFERVPEVGMGCTFLYISDRRPGTIVHVSPSGKTIKVRRAEEFRIGKCEMSDQQEYVFYHLDGEYTTQTYRLNKDNRWTSKGQRLSVSGRDYYYDYSF